MENRNHKFYHWTNVLSNKNDNEILIMGTNYKTDEKNNKNNWISRYDKSTKQSLIYYSRQVNQWI